MIPLTTHLHSHWTMHLKESLNFIYIHVSSLDLLAGRYCILMWDERYHLNRMLSNGANVIIWSKCYHVGRNVIIWDEMLSTGMELYHLGWNVIIWDEMLSSGANVIVWYYPLGWQHHPFLVFLKTSLTHSKRKNIILIQYMYASRKHNTEQNYKIFTLGSFLKIEFLYTPLISRNSSAAK